MPSYRLPAYTSFYPFPAFFLHFLPFPLFFLLLLFLLTLTSSIYPIFPSYPSHLFLLPLISLMFTHPAINLLITIFVRLLLGLPPPPPTVTTSNLPILLLIAPLIFHLFYDALLGTAPSPLPSLSPSLYPSPFHLLIQSSCFSSCSYCYLPRSPCPPYPPPKSLNPAQRIDECETEKDPNDGRI